MRYYRVILAAALVLGGAMFARAEAAEVKVLSAGAMRSVLQVLVPEFEKASKNKVTVEYGTAGAVEKQIDDMAEFDMAILTKSRLTKLSHGAKMAAGSVAVLASAPIGVAVRKGAPHPDISSVDAFKQALLKAKSIAYVDPASGGTSGIHMAKVFEKLGIASELKSKLHPVSAKAGQGSPRAAELVASGQADIAIQPISELMEVKGVDVVGPLPTELQTPELTYAAGLTFITAEPLAAKALIDFLASPKAAAVYKAHGLNPG
jgi:molybdate transport system substrate-binding protein